ncbi:hypothetical protein BJ508DRAFT_336413 [Ascobolus immersus RN42]|uniref:Uncharacterized protein n=1 Tax=Ascobolus immersus RN42 TaxID=1160509 RepID=A0A3N4HN63_ASCIM|nr:hypothetical protein BJ508DRAFT_336413 [Ascobolus immersus RN42]
MEPTFANVTAASSASHEQQNASYDFLQSSLLGKMKYGADITLEVLDPEAHNSAMQQLNLHIQNFEQERLRRQNIKSPGYWYHDTEVYLLPPGISSNSNSDLFQYSVCSLVAYIEYTEHVYRLLKTTPKLQNSALRRRNNRVSSRTSGPSPSRRSQNHYQAGWRVSIAVFHDWWVDPSQSNTRQWNKLNLLETVLELVEAWITVVTDDNNILERGWITWIPLPKINFEHDDSQFDLDRTLEEFWERNRKGLASKLQLKLIELSTEMMIRELKNWLVHLESSFAVYDTKQFGDRSTSHGQMCWERLESDMDHSKRLFERWERLLRFILGLRSESIEARIWRHLQDDGGISSTY